MAFGSLDDKEGARIVLIERTESEKKAYFEGYEQCYKHFRYLILKHKERNIALDKMDRQVELLRNALYKEGDKA